MKGEISHEWVKGHSEPSMNLTLLQQRNGQSTPHILCHTKLLDPYPLGYTIALVTHRSCNLL